MQGVVPLRASGSVRHPQRSGETGHLLESRGIAIELWAYRVKGGISTGLCPYLGQGGV